MTLLLGLVVLCFAWLAPGHFHPWINFQNAWAAAAGAVLIACAALSPRPDRRVRWPTLAVLTLVVALVPLIQLWAGQIRFVSDAALAALHLAGFALAMVAGATLVRQRGTELIGGLFAALLAAGIVSTGMAFVQWLQLGPVGYIADIGPEGRPCANLMQPNHLGTLLALAVIGVVWFFESRRIGAATALLSIAWLGLGLAMTRSRTGWLLMLFLVISWGWVRRRVALRTSPVGVGLTSTFFVAAVMLWGSLSTVAMLSTPPSFTERVHTGGGRILFWQSLIDALAASPWVGYGWTQVVVAAHMASLEHFTGESMLKNSHNLLLDLLLWNGIPLGLLLSGALALWFVRHWRRRIDADRWLLFAGVGAVFLHALVEYPLEYAYFLLPAGLMMGALDGLDDSSPSWQAPKASLVAPLLVMAGMLTWIAVEYMRVEESTRQLGLVQAGIGVDKVSTVPPPDVQLLDALREYHRFRMTNAHPGMSSAELESMTTIVERNPAPPALLRYALAMGLNGRRDAAADTLVRLCNMHREERCREGKEAWERAQSQYPELRAVPFPERALRILAGQR